MVLAKPEFARALARRNRDRRSDKYPIKFGFLFEQIIELTGAANAGLECFVGGREIGRVDELDAGRRF